MLSGQGPYYGDEETISNLPPHTLESLENYLERGWEPGGFVESMLAQDMERAITVADVVNRHHLYEIGRWIYAYCPEASWGSYEAVKNWCKDKDERRSKWVVWKKLSEKA